MEVATQTMIKALIDAKWHVTLMDIGLHQCEFVLAVKTVTPSDMWYLRGLWDEYGFPAVPCSYSKNDGLIYFPSLAVDAEGYQLILSQ